MVLPQLDPQGNLFNVYLDERGQRTITPVGNISQMQKFKVGGQRPAAAGRPGGGCQAMLCL